jgi:hypothetical protein
VHGRKHAELVGIDLEQVRHDPLHRRRRVHRRIGKAPLQLVEDLARVLQRAILRRHHDRNEREPGPRQDDVAVGLRRRQDLLVRDPLVGNIGLPCPRSRSPRRRSGR